MGRQGAHQAGVWGEIGPPRDRQLPHRHGQHARVRLFRDGPAAFFPSEFLIVWMPRHRDVVDIHPDILGPERLEDPPAVRREPFEPKPNAVGSLRVMRSGGSTSDPQGVRSRWTFSPKVAGLNRTPVAQQDRSLHRAEGVFSDR